MACIHGFAPGQCLICSTLQSGDQSAAGQQTATRAAAPAPAPAASSAPVLTATPSPAPTRHSRSHESRGAAQPAPAPGRSPRPHGRTFTEVLIILALIAAAVIAIGLSTEIIRGLIHILEVAFVGVVAGTIGYGAGRLHGAMRHHERERKDR
ncbi:MAG TPA: hypothetical protein VKV06_05910 [Acidimicrobiales bacterium]|nr:hypothetical protein [Acidimicrobiales bacterium]